MRKSATREERLAQALRANLKRRKQAARAQQSDRPPDRPPADRPNTAKKPD
jgi:hypothetical protein